ncbi:TPA: hypothetical protein HA281_04675 [Candidatus Woesearchaeota archaeon]|nr:MAG: hypothetical protein QT04_C0018G0018 [archaeon GW2011_AR11]MBS3110473.1 hypothetical protein [Candidatus Woesearchaeota archaeon]HIH04643.1 hypothetical protein [Candidatus Woesearchaeota archaeon]HIH92074.1 hypothetical protein [Candidatus Woesearchaeota archaeon]HII64959.1 hypothetical protein [Candidatus Woesearchaeota archaeon]
MQTTKQIQAQKYGQEEPNTGNLPEKRFSTGAVSATVWKNIGNGKEGPVEYRTVSFQRSYKDKKDDTWKTTSSLRLHDLPKATLVLQKAYEYLVMREQAEEAF